jgi:hypothetical protein
VLDFFPAIGRLVLLLVCQSVAALSDLCGTVNLAIPRISSDSLSLYRLVGG